jgi:hypothetical protein
VALASALVDRARIVRNTPQPVKVEGRTSFAKVTLPWFPCRVQMPARPRTSDGSGGRTRVEVRPTLLVGLRDSQGDLIDLTSSDQLEVEMKEIGERGFYSVDADPEPLRKKREVIGWQVSVRRVESHEFEERTV